MSSVESIQRIILFYEDAKWIFCVWPFLKMFNVLTTPVFFCTTILIWLMPLKFWNEPIKIQRAISKSKLYCVTIVSLVEVSSFAVVACNACLHAKSIGFFFNFFVRVFI
jgi:hypothetical protein